MSTSLYELYEKIGNLETQSIVFFDLVDSTYLKKQLGHSQGVNLTIKHNQTAAEVCRQFKGKVIKQIGDAIMVAFNTPLEGLLASLRFIETIVLEQLPFRTKIGLVHGIVKRFNFQGNDYFGSVVDLSARLTSQALPNQLITDETTINLLKPFFSDINQVISRFLGMRELKGFGKMPVYELSLENLGFANDRKKDDNTQLISPSAEGDSKESKPAPATKEKLPALAMLPSGQAPVKDAPLGKLLDSCRLSSQELDSIAMNYQNICHIIEKAHELNVRKISFSGTFARGVMIKPLETIDVVAVMAPSPEQGQNVTEVVNRLSFYFSQGYPNSVDINSKNRISITLQGIKFSIIPALTVNKSGKNLIMLPKGDFWVTINPFEPEQWMESALQRHGPSFLSFLHLLKVWQRSKCNMIKSFHLELLADLVASQTELNLSFESLYQWFRYIYTYFNKLKKPFIKDPFKSTTYVDEYLFSNPNTFDIFNRNFTDSYSIAIQGIKHYRSGKMDKAISQFKTLFGEYW